MGGSEPAINGVACPIKVGKHADLGKQLAEIEDKAKKLRDKAAERTG
jgi:hypothetical protein